MTLQELRDDLHERFDVGMAPLARLLTRIGFNPNVITLLGLSLSIVAAILILGGSNLIAGLFWLAAGAFDLLDGAMARTQRILTTFGAFLDSTVDRISEGVLFAAIIYHFAETGEPFNASLTAVALLGSFLVSYTRARAETLGAQCKVGFFTRAERVLLLGLGLCLDLVQEVIYLLVIMTAVTTLQRILHARRQLSMRK